MPLEGEALDSPVVIWIFFSKIAELLTSRDRKDRDSSNGSYLYRARNSVERFFNKIKQWRRVATRYDKLAANELAFIQLASIPLWLRVNEPTPSLGGAARHTKAPDDEHA